MSAAYIDQIGELKNHMKAKHAIVNNIENFVSYAMVLVMTGKVQVVEKPTGDQMKNLEPKKVQETTNIPEQKEVQHKPKRQKTNKKTGEKNWKNVKKDEMSKIQEMLLGEQDVSDDEDSGGGKDETLLAKKSSGSDASDILGELIGLTHKEVNTNSGEDRGADDFEENDKLKSTAAEGTGDFMSRVRKALLTKTVKVVIEPIQKSIYEKNGPHTEPLSKHINLLKKKPNPTD